MHKTLVSSNFVTCASDTFVNHTDIWCSSPTCQRNLKRFVNRRRALKFFPLLQDMLSQYTDSPQSRQRHRWFINEMGKSRSMFTREKPIRLFTGTWNVNGRSPQPNAKIDTWLFPVGRNAQPFDVYLLGFQEIQTLSGVDAVRSDIRRGKEWSQKIYDILGSDYDLIAERQLVGILVLVFLRKNHTPYLSDVQMSYAGTGFLNAMGNKGGVAARFKLYDRTISCVACHLAAHTEFVERRNQDFKDVVRKAVFLPVDKPEGSVSTALLETSRASGSKEDGIFGSSSELHKAKSSMPLGQASSNQQNGWFGSVAAVAAAFSDMSTGANTAILNDPNALRIFDHDVIFWLGDLNYRIDAPLQDVMRWIDHRDWHSLLQADQLKQQMKTCDVFQGFHEGPIRFAPTYKFDREGRGYKIGENGEPSRVPAYTDRILWRLGDFREGRESGTKPKIKLLEYCSAEVSSSDHRPVYASFEMILGVEDLVTKSRVAQRVNRELDKREEMLRPSLQFSSVIDLGDIFYEQRRTRKVAVRNTGSSTAFITVSIPENAPKWLLVDPSQWRNVEVPPGKAIQLHIGALITEKDGTANQICRNGCNMDAAINVMGEPGRLREQISVRGRYVATTLGLSLETLSMLERPVLALRDPNNSAKIVFSKEYKEEIDREQEPGLVPWSIPKELWLLIDALLRYLRKEESSTNKLGIDLFLRRGEEVDVQRVLSLVDRGQEIPMDIDPHATASCLLHVLKNLEESVVPKNLSKRVLEAGYAEDRDLVLNVLEMLPPLHSNVLWYFVGFLCEYIISDLHGDDVKQLAHIVGNALLPKARDLSNREEMVRTKFMMEVFRIHQEERGPRFTAIFDLSRPQFHPKKENIDRLPSG